MTDKELNATLKELHKKLVSEYERAADASRRAAIDTMRPGEPAPGYGILRTAQENEEMQDFAKGIRYEAGLAVDEWDREASKKRAESPTLDSFTAISLLKMQQKVTEGDISDLLGRYGENYRAHKALESIAEEHDIMIKPHPLSGSEEKKEDLLRIIGQYYSVGSVAADYKSAGKSWAFDLMIDQILPEN